MKVGDYVGKLNEEIGDLRQGLGLGGGLDGFDNELNRQEKKMVKIYNSKLDEIE